MSARDGVYVAHFIRSMFSPAGANEIIGSRENKFPQSAVVSPLWRVYPQTKGTATNKVTVGNGYSRPLNSPSGIRKTGKTNHLKQKSASFSASFGDSDATGNWVIT